MTAKAETEYRWNHDGRRAERLDVEMTAALRPSGSTKFNVEVLDMSVVGFRFDTTSTLRIDDRVWLTVPGMAGLESYVVWCSGHHYGCEFATPLHKAVLEHIVRQFRKRAKAS